MNRRQWLKSTSLGGSLALFGGMHIANALTLEETIKFNPRPFSKLIRLSSNENPYGPSKKVRDAIISSFDHSCRYPYAYADELAEILAKKEGVTKDHIIICGGSTEGLKITGLTFASNGGEIIAGKPTFLAMMTYAKQWGATINWAPVGEDKGYDMSEIEKRISSKTKLVFLCNPNNPTSTILPSQKLMDFCDTISNKTILFSDEAYYDYIDEPNYPSMVELVKKDKNVIVSRTFSKVYGMAGMRIGYLIAKPALTQKLRKNMVAYSNVPAIAAAKTALNDKEFYEFSLQKTREAKEMIYKTLDTFELPYVKSNTNFIFFKTGKDIRTLHKEMMDKGVLIGRPFPPFFNWCRISTGTIEEVTLFTKALSNIYQ
ncbi:pyridoxal phosphate-dependent aminotransferase [Aquimarina algiphila]|uniref:pyridoxal phosphate-dependent aminotransferase n=1 Tax=Aquimarina algiphila TaxID=2047982 RepID=UPI002493CBD0|nr:histidinol-phosphate transaminase [Aquimarina algiphila]